MYISCGSSHKNYGLAKLIGGESKNFFKWMKSGEELVISLAGWLGAYS